MTGNNAAPVLAKDNRRASLTPVNGSLVVSDDAQ
jgi:hypothetical protein